jgi:hypothetical protein
MIASNSHWRDKMFKPNEQHRQTTMFDSIEALPEKERAMLETSWAGTFYQEVFCRLDERPFEVLYSDEPSRPNVPVNVLVALEMLKAGFAWSDEDMIHNFYFNLQVRHALGLHQLGAGHFELRTVYNFRQRISQYMQQQGENLISRAFEQVTDEQISVLALKTGRLRMDSTYVASNIRDTSRLQLLVEVIQRVHRLLADIDQQRYAADFAPYTQGSAGQYVYRVRSEDGAEHMQRIGELMARLITALAGSYDEQPTYQMLQRVFHEHFVVLDARVRLKVSQELSASSLNSPDDVEATFHRKGFAKHRGYVANVTETCEPDNPVQLIVKVQTEPNVTADPTLLHTTLPALKFRLNLTELHTDGGYNNEATAELARDLGVDHVQTAIRGHAAQGVGLDQFDIAMSDTAQSGTITCPQGQRVPLQRRDKRFVAHFDAAQCDSCPLRDHCRPTERLKRKPIRALRCDRHDLEIARRRRRLTDNKREGQRNLRAAVESTIAALKYPFRRGKLPVRGQSRVDVVLHASATMVNLRRIHRYLRPSDAKNGGNPAAAVSVRPVVMQFLMCLRQLIATFLARRWIRPVPGTLA